MKAGVKMFNQLGMNVSTSKGLMRILLLNALSLGAVMMRNQMVPLLLVAWLASTSGGCLPVHSSLHGAWIPVDNCSVWFRAARKTSTSEGGLQPHASP
jgi:hypothetical protein